MNELNCRVDAEVQEGGALVLLHLLDFDDFVGGDSFVGRGGTIADFQIHTGANFVFEDE